jgi:D-alanyl-D-alanine carboxypeptidase
MRCSLCLLLTLLLRHSVLAQPATLDSFIVSYAQEHRFNGTILVHRDERISFARSIGVANISFQIPNARQTKYKIASTPSSSHRL